MQPTRTIAYLRVSTDKQADKGVSLNAQRAKVAAYCSRPVVSAPLGSRSARWPATWTARASRAV